MADAALSLADVDLNLLVALDALLQEHNVTRAGARLSLSQSTMSGTLSRLRLLFEDQLLVRTGRTMQLTPLAASLQAPVRDILGQIEQVIRTSEEFDPQRGSRTFTLMATDYAALVLLRPVRQALAAEAPGVQLRIRATGLAQHATLLERGDIDLAVVPHGLSRTTGLPSEAAITDRLVAVAWRGNFEVGDPLTMDHLQRLPYLGYRIGSQASMVDAVLREGGFTREADTLVESFVLGVLMLRDTLQITFLQERLAQRFAGPEQLRLMESPLTLPPLIETITWHPRATPDPAHRWLRTRILEVARNLKRSTPARHPRP
jgi:LysR family nod box-dependent transcriptional activator